MKLTNTASVDRLVQWVTRSSNAAAVVALGSLGAGCSPGQCVNFELNVRVAGPTLAPGTSGSGAGECPACPPMLGALTVASCWPSGANQVRCTYYARTASLAELTAQFPQQ